MELKIKSNNPSQKCIKWTLLTLLILTIIGFITFDYKGLDFWKAVKETFDNIKIMFGQAGLTNFALGEAIKQLGTTVALSFLTTLLGSIIALIIGFFAAKNLSNDKVAGVIRVFVALIRAIPTVLWVLIFAVTVGLGAEAAVMGMTFHTMGYLIKAYSETFEEIDEGVIEALKASGASWWHIVFQAVLPSSVTSILAWTFMRFEINFTNAVAMGAVAGAGGIGFELFMASSLYFNIREVGFIAVLILIVAILLESLSTYLKKKWL